MPIQDLLTRLNIPAETIEAFSAETFPANADDLIKDLNKSRFEAFKASEEFKNLVKSERDSTFSKSMLKFIKDTNAELDLGLTNAQMEEFKDVSAFQAHVKKHLADSYGKGADNSALLKDLADAKERASNYRKDYDKALAELEAARQETEIKVKQATDQLQAESYYMRLIQNDKELGSLDVPGKDFALDAIREKIFASVNIAPDGNITAKDGTPYLLPGKDVVVSKVDDLFKTMKEAAGLIKRSNAGTGGTGAAGVQTPSGQYADLDNHPDVLAAKAELASANRNR